MRKHMLRVFGASPRTWFMWSSKRRNSSSTSVAPTARPLMSQFHIIQPQVVK